VNTYACRFTDGVGERYFIQTMGRWFKSSMPSNRY